MDSRPQQASASAISSKPKECELKDGYLPSTICMISLEPFKQPVIAADGHTYEEAAFKDWVRQSPKRPLVNSPATLQPLASNHVQPNYVVKKLMDEYELAIIPRLAALKRYEEGAKVAQIHEAQTQELKAEVSRLQQQLRLAEEKVRQAASRDRNLRIDFEARIAKTELELAQVKQKAVRDVEAQSQQVKALQVQNKVLEAEVLVAKQVASGLPASGPGLFSSRRVEAKFREKLGEKLFAAVTAGILPTVKSLLSVPNISEALNAPYEGGATCLTRALEHYPRHPSCSKSIVKALCEAKAKVDLSDGQGNTPLHWAAHHNLSAEVDYLLQQGANPLIENDEGKTPRKKLLAQGSYNSLITRRLLQAEEHIHQKEVKSQRSRSCC